MIQLSFDQHLAKENFLELHIAGSKSESNRLLILQALFGNLNLINLSNSKDTQILQKALADEKDLVNVGHAGTAMRFLTAFLSVTTTQKVVIKGSTRMHQRPIKILVEALRSLGCKIDYLNKEGFPPLQIYPAKISTNKISLDASVSSQYITALLLIGPYLEKGIQISLHGKITSLPYLKMSVGLMQEVGFKVDFKDQVLFVEPQNLQATKVLSIESDWSSASYVYGAFLLSPLKKVQLHTFFKNSKQGDAYVAEFFQELGVYTTFLDNKITLEKNSQILPKKINLDLNQTPDLAQTLAVVGLILGIDMELTGLETLKIKETDRIEALKIEMEKLGAEVSTTLNSLIFKCPEKLNSNQQIKTYQDHRMAMAFALVCFITPVRIEAPDVVEKSYPNFWQDLKKFGVKIN